MKKQKGFDCIQMKWNIQREIAKEFKDVPDEKAYKIQMERVGKNPILGPFMKRVRSAGARIVQKS